MPYPYITDNDFPSVEYTIGANGEHLVRFWDHAQQDKTICATIKADVVLAVAYKMCGEHIDTDWAKQHLQAQGYTIEKKKPSYLADLLGF